MKKKYICYFHCICNRTNENIEINFKCQIHPLGYYTLFATNKYEHKFVRTHRPALR